MAPKANVALVDIDYLIGVDHHIARLCEIDQRRYLSLWGLATKLGRELLPEVYNATDPKTILTTLSWCSRSGLGARFASTTLRELDENKLILLPNIDEITRIVVVGVGDRYPKRQIREWKTEPESRSGLVRFGLVRNTRTANAIALAATPPQSPQNRSQAKPQRGQTNPQGVQPSAQPNEPNGPQENGQTPKPRSPRQAENDDALDGIITHWQSRFGAELPIAVAQQFLTTARRRELSPGELIARIPIKCRTGPDRYLHSLIDKTDVTTSETFSAWLTRTMDRRFSRRGGQPMSIGSALNAAQRRDV